MISKKIVLAEEVYIHNDSKIDNTTFEIFNEVGAYNYIENCHFGAYSYTGQFCFLQNVVLGKFVNIAANVRIGATDHPIKRASLHHFTYRPSMYDFDKEDDREFFLHRESRKVYIGHDVWIGHGATIMPEVRVGNGAVIGAGAVVTKDVPAFSVVGGVPAKFIKYRFDQEISNKLESVKWWDWDHEVLKARHKDFKLPIEKFLEKYYKGA